MNAHHIPDSSVLTTWRKSTHSDGNGGNCIEVADLIPASTIWRKSSYSSANGGDCIEVADGHIGTVPVRDSKDPHGPALLIEATAWTSFITAVKRGVFPTL